MSDVTDPTVPTINVTGKNIPILQFLDNFRKQYTEIRETCYMKDFAALRTYRDTRDPKHVIQYTLMTYLRSACDISKQQNLLKKYLFSYSDNNGITRLFEYSNNMLFKDDITILCFLSHASSGPTVNECEVVKILMLLMENKYGIDIGKEMRDNNTDSTQKQNKIILRDVAMSYPSITWDMSIDTGMYTCTWLDKFSDFNLPKRIFFPQIIFLLPNVTRKTINAILMLVVFKKLEDKGIDINIISTDEVFMKISRAFAHEIFPRRLKLELCMRWGIVVKRKNMYKYNACFLEHRQKAKDIIAQMKSNDPYLQMILLSL